MNEQNSDICGSPIAESKKPSAQPSGETRQDDALQPAAAGKADTIASALSPATEKASDPAQNCAQRDKSVVSASFLAGLDLFSEEYDDESEPFIIPSAANGAGHENSVQCEDTVPQAAEPLTLAHELLKAGTVLQSMEDGLPDLMDLDYVPEPDEILLQRYEFEGSMYQEPAQRTEPMRITPEAATH